MRLPDEHSVAGVKVAHPDLRRISGFRSPDESFAVWRKPRALLMIRRWIQSSRFTAAGLHDPQTRNPRVRFEIDIYAIEDDPFAIRRRQRRADPLKFHHVLKRERMLCRCLPKRKANECKKRDQKLESHIVLILTECAAAPASRLPRGIIAPKTTDKTPMTRPRISSGTSFAALCLKLKRTIATGTSAANRNIIAM